MISQDAATEIAAIRTVITAREDNREPTRKQVLALILSSEYCLVDPDHRLGVLSAILGRQIASQNQMTSTEHSILLRYLRGKHGRTVIERGKVLLAELEANLEEITDDKAWQDSTDQGGSQASLSSVYAGSSR